MRPTSWRRRSRQADETDGMWRSTPFLNSLLFFVLAITVFLTLNAAIGLLLDLGEEPGVLGHYVRFLVPFWAVVGGVAALRAWRRRHPPW
jgi:anti-sigma-K factor RskA